MAPISADLTLLLPFLSTNFDELVRISRINYYKFLYFLVSAPARGWSLRGLLQVWDELIRLVKIRVIRGFLLKPGLQK